MFVLIAAFLEKYGANNGIQVDQGGARKAKQKPEGEMEGAKTTAASEAR
jgi:hypothetical protein